MFILQNIKKAKKSGIFLKSLEAVIYLFIVNASYLAVMYIDVKGKYTDVNFQAYRSIALYLTIFTLFILMFNKMFQTMKLSKTENILIVLSSTIMIALMTIALAFVFRGFAMPRSVIILGFIIQTIFFITIKIVMKSLYDIFKKEKRTALICSENSTKKVVQSLFGSSKGNEKEKLIFATENCVFHKDLFSEIDKVYIYDINDSESIEKFIHICILNGIQICILPKSYELAMTKSTLYLSSDVPLIKMNKLGITLEYRFIKRAMDIIISLIAIILTSPIMLIATIIIYLSDGYPVLFKQKRVTINNRVFTIYKFRTMIKDAEKNTGAVWAEKDDPRITKVGKFMRKYWIDELPQLFNVLKGDMSIVGPRPERPELIKEFVKDIPDFKMRTLVKCGLTGYAQVMAKYDTTPANKLKLDLFYILNTNLLLDINIMILTLRKMILRFIGFERPSKTYKEILKEWEVIEIKKEDGTIFFKYN